MTSVTNNKPTHFFKFHSFILGCSEFPLSGGLLFQFIAFHYSKTAMRLPASF